MTFPFVLTKRNASDVAKNATENNFVYFSVFNCKKMRPIVVSVPLVQSMLSERKK